MHFYVGITDKDWFTLNASRTNPDEVNFWKPSPSANFKALAIGEPLLFKLHAPLNYIVGGGFFTRFLHLPINLAWEAFGEANGVSSQEEMRNRIANYRGTRLGPRDNPNVGCILLSEPFFWPREMWIDSPKEFSRHTQQGKGFEADFGVGKEIWDSVAERLKKSAPAASDNTSATVAAINSGGHGKPQIILPRLGQGSFRMLLTEVYGKRCAITGERTLPVLDAAHIRPYNVFPRHELSNGLLLRSDLHRLFDNGYITVDPASRKVIVSKRIREEFENGRDYYRLEGTALREPIESIHRPLVDHLEYHANRVFR